MNTRFGLPAHPATFLSESAPMTAARAAGAFAVLALLALSPPPAAVAATEPGDAAHQADAHDHPSAAHSEHAGHSHAEQPHEADPPDRERADPEQPLREGRLQHRAKASPDHAGQEDDHGEPHGAAPPGEPDARGHDPSEAGHELALPESQRSEFGLVLREAGPGTLKVTRRLTGEVVYNPDRYAHAVPRAAGVARSVAVRIGDRVKAGQALATLDSRELAEARGRYLAALSREEIARANHQRESDLWKRKVSSEREFLEARQALAEARVERRLAEHLLHALGLTDEQIDSLSEREDAALTRYEMQAPIGGVVVERHVVPGEVLREGSAEPPFVIADLSTVWVNLTVYPRDLAVIREDQEVRVHGAGGSPPTHGRIDYVAPALEEATRTATARVVLSNPHGLWKPGLFVTADVTVAEIQADVLIPREAVQRLDGRDVVFVPHERRLEPRAVELGEGDAEHVAVRAGLRPGEPYVARNAFALKAELGKEGFGGHSH